MYTRRQARSLAAAGSVYLSPSDEDVCVYSTLFVSVTVVNIRICSKNSSADFFRISALFSSDASFFGAIGSVLDMAVQRAPTELNFPHNMFTVRKLTVKTTRYST